MSEKVSSLRNLTIVFVMDVLEPNLISPYLYAINDLKAAQKGCQERIAYLHAVQPFSFPVTDGTRMAAERASCRISSKPSC
jgi:hypothetical protein